MKSKASFYSDINSFRICDMFTNGKRDMCFARDMFALQTLWIALCHSEVNPIC